MFSRLYNLFRLPFAVCAMAGLFAFLPSEGRAGQAWPPPAGATLLGFYSWNPGAFTQTAGRAHAVRWETIDWDPRNNFGQTWPETIAAAEAGGWALQVTWTSERYHTTLGGPVEAISPGAIALGEGDARILEAASALRAATVPVVLRFDPEMNGYWHSYCAVNRDRSLRDADHSTTAFIAAWRRVRTIFKGGTVAEVDAALEALGQPPLSVSTTATVGAPDVPFAWVPNISANPAVAENTHLAKEYYPGDAYVDWVGVDIYDSLPNNSDWAFNRELLNEQYAAHPAKPFGFFEWGLLSRTDDAQFVSDAFDWIDTHPRVALIDWYDNSSSRLVLNPAAAAVYRKRIQAPRYVSSWPSATSTNGRRRGHVVIQRNLIRASRAGTLTVPVACVGQRAWIGCRGRLVVSPISRPAGGRHSAPDQIAAAQYSIPAGTGRRIRLRLVPKKDNCASYRIIATASPSLESVRVAPTLVRVCRPR